MTSSASTTARLRRSKPLSRKPKRRKPVAVGKPQTRSAVKKGPARDEKHLAKVRGRPCIVCKQGSVEVVRGRYYPKEAHHVRCIGLRTMGVRVSDYLAVPLCHPHHIMLHGTGEQAFWNKHAIDPAAWIAQFSPEGAAEIERIERRKVDGSVVLR